MQRYGKSVSVSFLCKRRAVMMMFVLLVCSKLSTSTSVLYSVDQIRLYDQVQTSGDELNATHILLGR